MRNQDAGGVFQNKVQRLLNLPLGKGINACSGFIQDEYRWPLHQNAQKRYKLTLPH